MQGMTVTSGGSVGDKLLFLENMLARRLASGSVFRRHIPRSHVQSRLLQQLLQRNVACIYKKEREGKEHLIGSFSPHIP